VVKIIHVSVAICIEVILNFGPVQLRHGEDLRRHAWVDWFVFGTWKLFLSRFTSVHSASEALRLCAISIYYWHIDIVADADLPGRRFLFLLVPIFYAKPSTVGCRTFPAAGLDILFGKIWASWIIISNTLCVCGACCQLEINQSINQHWAFKSSATAEKPREHATSVEIFSTTAKLY